MTATATAATSAATTTGRRSARVLRLLPAVTLAAVLTITASAEYELARTVLGLPPHIAWALPVAVDSYVLAALRSGRDVPAALTVMAGALAASMGAHLAVTRQGPDAELPAQVVAPAATAIMTVLVVVAWRVHVLIDHHASGPPPSAAPAAPTTSADTPAASTPTADTPAPSTPTPTSTPRPPAPAATASPPGPPRPAAVAVLTGAGYTRPSRARTHPPSASLPDVSDAEILAAIAGGSPGVRALMRTHGIGQSRATRLHRQAISTDPTSSSNQDNDHEQDNNQTQNDEKSQENNDMSRDENQKNNTQKINSENEGHEQEERSKESRSKAEQESDTCITDRVGQFKINNQSGDLGLREFAGAGEA